MEFNNNNCFCFHDTLLFCQIGRQWQLTIGQKLTSTTVSVLFRLFQCFSILRCHKSIHFQLRKNSHQCALPALASSLVLALRCSNLQILPIQLSEMLLLTASLSCRTCTMSCGDILCHCCLPLLSQCTQCSDWLVMVNSERWLEASGGRA